MEENPFESQAAPTAGGVGLEKASVGVLAGRSAFGGFLMGLANLVPGISGGTMLLAAGIYPAFIDALSDVTRFKFKFRSLLLLALVGLSAGIGILFLAGTLKSLVINQRWVMYSLFIGLTLGGVPVVWKMVGRFSGRLLLPAVVAFSAMVGLAIAQSQGIVGSGSSSFLMMLLAGLAGASAMILPGLSGGYLLLLMGQYLPILGAIHEFKDAISERDVSAAMGPALTVMLPVGIGVVLGIVIVGNLLKWLLRKYRTETLGFLLGLLVGSVAGLFPFQQGRQPEIGDTIKAQVVTAENVDTFDADDWPVEFFQPTGMQVGSSVALALLGFGITLGVSLIGRDDSDEVPAAAVDA